MVAGLIPGAGSELPAEPRARFESSLGSDLSGVRVHTGADSAHAAGELGARAFTTGNDIHFGSGQYQPDDPFGLHLLAHEVAHTVQQGGAAGPAQAKLEVSRAGDPLEVQADHAADAMVRGEPAAVSRGVGSIVQRREGEGDRARGRGNEELGRRTDGDNQGEDGSGDWGSNADDRNLTDRASWYMWSRVATAAEAIGLVNAARHMRHYLGNTGSTLNVSVDNMLRDVPSFRTAYDTELDEAKTQANARIAGLGTITSPQTFTLTGQRRSNVYCTKSESQDWFFAVGGFTHWWTAEVTVTPPEGGPQECTPENPDGAPTGAPRVSMRFVMHMHDRYNWDQGKSVTIAGITVRDEQLGRLHRVGLAQEYDVEGEASPHAETWTYSGSAPSPSSGAAPQGGARDGGRTDPTGDRGSIRGNTRGSPGAPRGR